MVDEDPEACFSGNLAQRLTSPQQTFTTYRIILGRVVAMGKACCLSTFSFENTMFLSYYSVTMNRLRDQDNTHKRKHLISGLLAVLGVSP